MQVVEHLKNGDYLIVKVDTESNLRVCRIIDKETYNTLKEYMRKEEFKELRKKAYKE